jgi:AraC-like DNA-binding protein
MSGVLPQAHNEYAAYQPGQGVGALAFERVWRVDERRHYDVRTSPLLAYQTICLRTVSGKGRVTFRDGREFSAGADTVLLFHYSDCSRYRCTDERWHFWWFVFRANGPLTLPFDTLIHLPTNQGELDELESCFRLLRGANATAAAHGALRMHARVASYILEWRRIHTPSDRSAAAVERAIALMQNTPAGLTVTRMAEEAFLGERRFREVFRRATGTTPKRYYDTLRLEHAAQLLMATPLSVAQVADRLGFSSPYHFSRTFRLHFGRPPSTYRGR